MNVEQKQLSRIETLAYISSSLPIIGTLYGSQNNKTEIVTILKDTAKDTKLNEILLTSDFLYLKTDSPEGLNNALILALAELEDYFEINSKPFLATNNNLKEKICLILQTIIAPLLKNDGGDIKFIEVKNNIAFVRFLGKCQNCPYAQKTLKNHVQKNLLHYLPQIKEVKLA